MIRSAPSSHRNFRPSRLPTLLLLLIAACSLVAARGEVLILDFNDISGETPLEIAGTANNENLGAWTSDDSELVVVAGDLHRDTLPPLSDQVGTPQSIIGRSPAAVTAQLLNRWTTAAHGNTFWFAFLFKNDDAAMRAAINLNSLRIVAFGNAVFIAGAEDAALGPLPLGEAHLVVGRIDIDQAEAAPDLIEIWVDPADLENIPSSAAATSTFEANHFYDQGIYSVGLESYSENGNIGGTLDRVVIGTSLEEIVAGLTK